MQKEHTSGNDEEEEEDPFEKRLRETGCDQLHYELQECMSDHDWRKCQPQVSDH